MVVIKPAFRVAILPIVGVLFFQYAHAQALAPLDDSYSNLANSNGQAHTTLTAVGSEASEPAGKPSLDREVDQSQANGQIEADREGNEEPETSPVDLFVGAELYGGFSNLPGTRHLRDGFWPAGSGVAYPSVLQMRMATRKRIEGKVSLGVGKLYTDEISSFRQPVEAWIRIPLGKSVAENGAENRTVSTLTAGKFYVPMALKEWEYETKWGALLETSRGKNAIAMAVTRDRHTQRNNVYARAAHDFGANLKLGISLASGEGLSYGSTFNRAFALDLFAARGNWNVSAEYLRMRNRARENFRFGWVKLLYVKSKKIQPFLAFYNWKDSSGEFGNYKSTALGAQYQWTPNLALEGGVADTSAGNRFWLQLHWLREWQLARSVTPAEKPAAFR